MGNGWSMFVLWCLAWVGTAGSAESSLLENYRRNGLVATAHMDPAEHQAVLDMELALSRWATQLMAMRRNTAPPGSQMAIANMSKLVEFCGRSWARQDADRNNFVLDRLPTIASGADLHEASTLARGVNVAQQVPVPFPWVFSDGLGHSLVSYLRMLLAAATANCTAANVPMALPLTRFGVWRNYVFVPWCRTPKWGESGPGDGAECLHAESYSWATEKHQHEKLGRFGAEGPPRNISALYMFAKPPQAFLYCHELQSTREFMAANNSHKWKHRRPQSRRGLTAKNRKDTDGDDDEDFRPTFSSREEYLAAPAFAENMECVVLRADLWKVLCDTVTNGRCLSEVAEVVVMKSDHPGEVKQSYGYSQQVGNDVPMHGHNTQQLVAPLRYGYMRDAGHLHVRKNKASEHVSEALDRLRREFWDNVKAEWTKNSALPDAERAKHTDGSELRANAPSDFFQCNHDKDALDVAIHVRRGDVFDSTVLKDADRLLGIGVTCSMIQHIRGVFHSSRLLRHLFPLGLRFHVHSQSTDFPPPLGRHKTLPEFANISFNLPENDLFLHSNSSAEAFRTAENNSKMFCPVGQCVGGSTKPVKASFCLNAHPVYDLNCMAKADMFIAAPSQFSVVVAATTEALFVVDRRAADYFKHKVCGLDHICEAQLQPVSVPQLTRAVLENHFVHGIRGGGARHGSAFS